jgi:uncharacterized protein (TIGR03437 family)
MARNQVRDAGQWCARRQKICECERTEPPQHRRYRCPVTTILLSSTWLLCCAASVAGQSRQSITIAAVVNSADFQPGMPQKGSLASIFTTGLEGEPQIVTSTQNPLSNVLNGVSVWVDSVPAPILSIAFRKEYQQINFQVPWELVRDPVYVEVLQNGTRAYREENQPKAFSVFFSDATGRGIVQHSSDYSLVTTENPASPGEYLVAYGINLGPVSNAQKSGVRAPVDPLAVSMTPGSPQQGICSMEDVLTIGLSTTTPSYVGLSPELVGVYQINFQVPLSVLAGDSFMTFVRALTVNPFGPCRGSGLGNIGTIKTSRAVNLPIR